MKKTITIAILSFVPWIMCFGAGGNVRKISPVDFSDVKIHDQFWSPRLESHKNVTLPVCIDQIENQTGRIRNFENAAKGRGEHSGIFFDDSDVYKALEGMENHALPALSPLLRFRSRGVFPTATISRLRR